MTNTPEILAELREAQAAAASATKPPLVDFGANQPETEEYYKKLYDWSSALVRRDHLAGRHLAALLVEIERLTAQIQCMADMGIRLTHFADAAAKDRDAQRARADRAVELLRREADLARRTAACLRAGTVGESLTDPAHWDRKEQRLTAALAEEARCG